MKLKHLRKAFQSLKLLPVGLNYSIFLRASQIYFHILSSESSVQMLKWENTRYKKGNEGQLQGRPSSCKKIVLLSHGWSSLKCWFSQRVVKWSHQNVDMGPAAWLTAIFLQLKCYFLRKLFPTLNVCVKP